jgi:hypothetical protein
MIEAPSNYVFESWTKTSLNPSMICLTKTSFQLLFSCHRYEQFSSPPQLYAYGVEHFVVLPF